MAAWSGMTVAEILKHKKGSIKSAGLDPGSPSWDDLLDVTWEQIEERARQNQPGYRTIKKLLGKRRYDK